ncbi:MAG: hypothetical protein NTX53_10230 [candidate division WOR-3 bacterium]|nr:hypothetical protein [candidate division WOR-3 bacterium]
MKTVSVMLSVLFLVSFVPAQQTWGRTYGGTNSDNGKSVQQTADGGYIVAGYTYSFGAGITDVYLIKTNASGDTVWTRTYGGTGGDVGNAVQQTSDGGYIVIGSTYSFGAGGVDVYLIKTDALGEPLWTGTFGGPRADEGWSGQQTADHGYIIAGCSDDSQPGRYRALLVKTDSLGSVSWFQSYGGATYNNYALSVMQTSDDGYIMAGYTTSSVEADVLLIKTDASGNAQWTRTYGGSKSDNGYSVRETRDGGYIVAGDAASFRDTVNADVYLIKTNASGDTVWTRTYGTAEAELGKSIQQTEDGGYIVAGNTTTYGNYDVYLVRTDASGDAIWSGTYGGAGLDQGEYVRQTSDRGYVIAGQTNSRGAGALDVYLIKTDSNGVSGVEEPGCSRRVSADGLKATPNPFVSFARIPGHEAEQFSLYDISGKMVGVCRGNRVAEGLLPAVYFIKPDGEHRKPLRIVKVR